MTIDQVDRSGGHVERAEVSRGLLALPAPASGLQQFAADVKAAVEVAMVLAPTPFVPNSYRRRGDRWLEREDVAATVAAAMLAGAEVGLTPMQSLQAIDVIEGRPALNALAQRALVQSHGHEVWIHERSSDAPGQRASVSVTVRGRRAGSDRTAEATWSLDRARQADLLRKQNWQKHPEAMCYARASSEVCRQIAADVLMGLAYTVEELQDDDSVDAGGHTVEVRPPQQGEAAEQVEVARRSDPVGMTPEEVRERDAREAQERAEREHEEGLQRQQEQLEEFTPRGGPACGEPKADGKASCSRPQGHEGRHYYGGPAPTAAGADAPEPGAQPAEEGTTRWRSDGDGSADDLLATGEVEGDDGLFREPTDAELEAAFLAEQRQRRGVEDTELPDPPNSEGVAPVAPPAPAELPVEAPTARDEAATAAAAAAEPGEDADPWADFR